MVGDYWVSDKTGRIYEVGPRGTTWPVVGQVDDLENSLGLAALLGFVGTGLGFGLAFAVAVAAAVGLMLGALVAFLPQTLPLGIPLLILFVLVTGTRAVVTHRRLIPLLQAVVALGAVLVVAVLNTVYWRNGPNLYASLASLPLMPLLTASVAVWAASGRRWALMSLLLAQSLVFASTYLGALGSLAYAQSSTGMDNLLSVVFWLCLACLVRAWLTPRQGTTSAVEAHDHRPPH